MRLSVAIMAHPKRAHFVSELEPLLPGAEVVWDRMNDRWDTGRRSQLSYDHGADWHLVVQDDAVLCPDFLPGVEKALQAVPGNPVAFYMGKVRPHARRTREAARYALAEGSSWVTGPGPWWGVAVATPTERIKDMIAYCDQRKSVGNYDIRMAHYWASVGVECWYSVPSLVDHRVGIDNPSLVPGRGNSAGRTAVAYIGEFSPLDIDWCSQPVELGSQQSPPLRRMRTWRHADGRTRRTSVGTDTDLRYAELAAWQEVVEAVV